MRTVIIQEGLVQVGNASPIKDLGNVVFCSKSDWREIFTRIESGLGPEGRVFALCSLTVARRARTLFPKISRGIWIDEAPLRVSSFTGLVPETMLLNRTGIFLPLGTVSGRTDQIRSLYGDQVFIRPDSPMKAFAGTVCRTDDLAAEVSAIRQVNALHGDVLVFVDRAREIGLTEVRFWACDGEIVTAAPYAHDGEEPVLSGEDFGKAERLARRVAAIMEPVVNPVVIDVVFEDGEARLVEMNAFSTSGVYAGADVRRIVEAGLSVVI